MRRVHFFLKIWFSLRFYREKAPHNEPFSWATPLQTATKNEILQEFKEFLGQHQNKSDKKNEPSPNRVFENLIGTVEINKFQEHFWNFLGQRPPNKYHFLVFDLAILSQNPGGHLGLERVHFRATFGVAPPFWGPSQSRSGKKKGHFQD